MTKMRFQVQDPLQKGYSYIGTEPEGKNFAPDFHPDLTPKQMLRLGVFGGNYFEGEIEEFPSEWFTLAKLSDTHDIELNFFKIGASQSREEWQRQGWMHKDDPRGWFQWYCRYYLGRRLKEEDERQIKRWRQMVRHVAQIKHKCIPGNYSCNTRQRQALLHWAYDSRKM